MTEPSGKVKNYLVLVTVNRAEGHQVYRVKARSPKDAIQQYEKDGGEFVEEEIEVTDLCEPHIADVLEEPQ